MRKKTLSDYKKGAPELPTNTCPYIDFIQEVIKEVQDESDSILNRDKLELAISTLEYVRVSNEQLRQNGFYWFNKFKNLFK